MTKKIVVLSVCDKVMQSDKLSCYRAKNRLNSETHDINRLLKTQKLTQVYNSPWRCRVPGSARLLLI